MAGKKQVREVGVAEFKAHCTTIMPEVSESGQVVRVMKRGQPLVDIHPASVPEATPFIGRLAGSVTREHDIEQPLDAPWHAAQSFALVDPNVSVDPNAAVDPNASGAADESLD